MNKPTLNDRMYLLLFINSYNQVRRTSLTQHSALSLQHLFKRRLMCKFDGSWLFTNSEAYKGTRVGE